MKYSSYDPCTSTLLIDPAEDCEIKFAVDRNQIFVKYLSHISVEIKENILSPVCHGTGKFQGIKLKFSLSPSERF